MTNPALDLLGDPLPEPLPSNLHLTDIEELVGHTIKAAIENPNGRRDADLLIVTETNCWMAFCGEPGDDDESASARIVGPGFGKPMALSDFASPITLKNHGCISESEYAYLKEKDDEVKRVANVAYAARLRAHAARLEAEVK